MPEILGIRVDNLNLEEAREKVRGFLNSQGQHKIYTPNPEMAVKAQNDKLFKEVLNRGDLNLCDGFGLRVFSGAPRLPGADFMLEICKIAESQGNSIFLLGSGSDEIAERAAQKLQGMFPKLSVVGFNKGPDINERDIHVHAEGPHVCGSTKHGDVLEMVNHSNAQILFVAFGMGKQEKWIDHNLSKMPQVKIAMGVGGAFDYLAGAVPRAPRLMRQVGLEWLYRLARQPKRFGRIVNATAKFTYLALKEKFL